MKKVNKNKDLKVKMIKHYIKDLSFENPQNINDNNAINNNNNNINVNMSIIYKPYNENFFSLVLKHTIDCASKENNKQLFNLELDYFGFFKSLKNLDDQKSLTKEALTLIFPFAKEIIEDITKKGGSIIITLNDLDINIIEI